MACHISLWHCKVMGTRTQKDHMTKVIAYTTDYVQQKGMRSCVQPAGGSQTNSRRTTSEHEAHPESQPSSRRTTSEREEVKPSPAKSQGSEAAQQSPGASSQSSLLGEDAGAHPSSCHGLTLQGFCSCVPFCIPISWLL